MDFIYTDSLYVENPQNQSIQAELNQSLPSSQKDVQDLQQSKEKSKYIFELPNGEGRNWFINPVTVATWMRCSTAEAYAAWDQHVKAEEAKKLPKQAFP